MSSKGTTTKASVAPAVAPVRIDSDWFILLMLNKSRYVLPQASFAANLVALDTVRLDSGENGAWGAVGGECFSEAYLFGASMRMGALMPRYNREKLSEDHISTRQDRDISIECDRPLILDDLSEAVHHAIVTFLTNAFALL